MGISCCTNWTGYPQAPRLVSKGKSSENWGSCAVSIIYSNQVPSLATLLRSIGVARCGSPARRQRAEPVDGCTRARWYRPHGPEKINNLRKPGRWYRTQLGRRGRAIPAICSGGRSDPRHAVHNLTSRRHVPLGMDCPSRFALQGHMPARCDSAARVVGLNISLKRFEDR